MPSGARSTLSRSGDHRAARHARSQGADHRRRLPDRPASQSVQGLQRRVRGVPAVPARRRPGHARLEGLRAIGSALRQEVRGRDQPHVPPAARRQRVDGLRLGRRSPSCNTRSYLAGALAYLMNRQRDSFGLIAFDDSISALLPASARSGHLRTVLLALERLQLGHAHQRRQAAARPGRGGPQARPGGADLGSARRSGDRCSTA